jgi:hypothetical protein
MRADDGTSHLLLLGCQSFVRPLTLLTELDVSRTGFFPCSGERGEETFAHILYKQFILITDSFFEILHKFQK